MASGYIIEIQSKWSQNRLMSIEQSRRINERLALSLETRKTHHLVIYKRRYYLERPQDGGLVIALLVARRVNVSVLGRRGDCIRMVSRVPVQSLSLS